jgi:hypothetical protein
VIQLNRPNPIMKPTRMPAKWPCTHRHSGVQAGVGERCRRRRAAADHETGAWDQSPANGDVSPMELAQSTRAAAYCVIAAEMNGVVQAGMLQQSMIN